MKFTKKKIQNIVQCPFKMRIKNLSGFNFSSFNLQEKKKSQLSVEFRHLRCNFVYFYFCIFVMLELSYHMLGRRKAEKVSRWETSSWLTWQPCVDINITSQFEPTNMLLSIRIQIFTKKSRCKNIRVLHIIDTTISQIKILDNNNKQTYKFCLKKTWF